MRTLLLCIATTLALTSAASADPGHHHEIERAPSVPPGHLPPPGACRVWVPGVPPGHQAPPSSCHEAFHAAHPHTWVVERDHHGHTHYHAVVPRPAPRPAPRPRPRRVR